MFEEVGELEIDLRGSIPFLGDDRDVRRVQEEQLAGFP
jgi:hypothetical protein